MPRCLRDSFSFAVMLCAGMILPSSGAFAQERAIRVMGDDGEPVAFANVTLAGERPRITNEKGEVAVGSAARAEFTVDVRRLGYEPWYGKLVLDDTVMMARVTLHRISRRMFTVKVTDSSRAIPAYLRGFYERMLARQRGIGNGIYLPPEEVDRHNTNLTTALLQGLNGVSLQRTSSGKMIAMNSEGTCQMTVLIDGHRVCPPGGCDGESTTSPSQPSAGRNRSKNSIKLVRPGDDQFVLVDDLLSENQVAAVEVYPRGASIPPSLPTVDASCGLIAFWTGGRKAP
jgi:hypothetical protein